MGPREWRHPEEPRRWVRLSGSHPWVDPDQKSHVRDNEMNIRSRRWSKSIYFSRIAREVFALGKEHFDDSQYFVRWSTHVSTGPLGSHARVRSDAPLLIFASASALPFNNLIVFGDSIVDTGNTQTAVVGAFGSAADPAPASAGYFGGRFTNGINPADVLNQEIEGTNAVGSIYGGDNYAFGGARARDEGDFLPDVVNQVISYTTRRWLPSRRR